MQRRRTSFQTYVVEGPRERQPLGSLGAVTAGRPPEQGMDYRGEEVCGSTCVCEGCGLKP